MKPVGPYCWWPRDTWDGTCTHPPGSADVVAELRREHLERLDRRVGLLPSYAINHGGAHVDIGTDGETPVPLRCSTENLRCKATGPRGPEEVTRTHEASTGADHA